LVAEPTKLFPTRNKVENINNTKMCALQGDEKEFKIKYLKDLEMSKADREARMNFTDKEIQLELEFLSSNLICDKEMKLKIGAQVMCVVNIQSDTGLEVCNGSQGIVTDFCEITGCPRVKFNNGSERIMTRHVWASDKIPGIGVSQVPLILAWALTIHKSQGATLDAAEIDVGSGIFECGQTYVALSRVKSLQGLYLTSFDANRIRINKKVKDYYEALNLYQAENIDTIQTVPLAIAEAVHMAEAVLITNEETISNPFSNYRYIEPQSQAELAEENYEEETKSDINNEIRVIRLK
jgi:ATP-dependent DNA helicase PIF1